MDEGYNNEENREKESKGFQVSGGILFLCAAILVVVTAFVTFFIADNIYFGGFFMSKSNKVSFNEKTVDTYKVAKLQSVINSIEEEYCLAYDIDDLVEGAIDGIMKALKDPYSNYYAPKDMDDYMEYLTGEYKGIGISYNVGDEGFEIQYVVEQSPAENAGLEVGDRIIKINGIDVKEIEDDVLRSILSNVGTSATLTIKRKDASIKDVLVVPQEINESSVYTKDYGSVRYVRITQFDNDTGTEFKDAVTKIEQDGCKAVILDLRDNGGGYEKEAGMVSDLILPEGRIAYTKDKNGDIFNELQSDASYLKLPIILLVNEYTASASEIVTGAFRDFKRGTIIGVKTFGKGIGQISRVFDEDGSGFSLTVIRCYTPSGECIHGVGIQPDITVENSEKYSDVDVSAIPDGEDAQLVRALEEINKMIGA